MSADAITRAARMRCWSGTVTPQPITGGITNANFVVHDRGQRFFVRVGDDIPEHGVWRWNELAASRAAHAAGISPAVVYAEPGAMVLSFIEGKALRSEDLHQPATLERVLPLVKRCHREIGRFYRGPTLLFWVFQVARSYAATLRSATSPHVAKLDHLMETAAELEAAVGPVQIAFGHNDLLAANFIDDGERLWLVDWDYAGFNSPLFDLGGLASNNELPPELERWLLEEYFETPLSANLEHRYGAMKCASLLREAMWSMVSEIHSTVNFDFANYTGENLRRLENAYESWRKL